MLTSNPLTPPESGGLKARWSGSVLAFAAACLATLLVSCSSKTDAPAAPAIATQPTAVTVVAPAPASFTVTATGTAPTYQWAKNGTALAGATGASYTTPATSPADDGATFAVTVANAQGSVVSAIATLHVNFISILSQPTTQVASTGDTAQFAVGAAGPAGGTLSYQWKKDGVAITGATAATLSLPGVTSADMASYTCAVTCLLNGTVTPAVTSAAAGLALVDPPTITGQPLDQAVVEGTPATLAVTATGGGTLSYQWKVRNQTIAGATSATLLLPAVSLADEGSYTCLVTNTQNGGSLVRSTTTAFLGVVTLPVITTQPAGGAFLFGDPFTLTTAATGNGVVTYQWREAGVNLPGATDPTYAVTSAALADEGAYTCLITNSKYGVSATATTQVATVTVVGAPVITAQPAARSVLVGQTATFNLTAKGAQPLSYVWYKNGVAIASSNSDTYTTPTTLLADDGAKFKCIVTNPFGSTTSSEVTLAVLDVLATFKASTASLTKGEGVILLYKFRGGTTATLQVGSGTPAAVTSGGTLIDYPSVNTTYTLTVTEAGIATAFPLSVVVRTYTPKHYYGVNFGSNNIKRYPVDTTIPVFVKGALGSAVTTGAGPVHIAASPDETYLYTANFTDSSVSAFSADPATGQLTALGTTPLATYGSPWCSAVNPAGTRLYVACDNGVEVFTCNAGVVAAAPALAYPLPGRVKGDLLMHPSGEFLFVLDNGHAKVKVLAIDPVTGALSFASEAATASNPKGLVFDRAASLVFTRGADARVDGLGNAFNAAIDVFSMDFHTGVITAKSVYAGYGPNAFTGNDNPFVPGLNLLGRHGLAASRKQGVDQVFSGYSTEQYGLVLSQWDVDVANGVLLGDTFSPFWGAGSPFWSDLMTAGGDAIVGDRSGTVFIYSLDSDNQIISYQCDPQGRLSALANAFGEIAYATGTTPAHGCFRGTLQ